MINNIQKLTMAMTLAYLSDDMKVSIVSIPKCQNRNFCLVSTLDDKKQWVMPSASSDNVDDFFYDIVKNFYESYYGEELPECKNFHDTYKYADKLFHEFMLLEGNSKLDEDAILTKLSNGVSEIEKDMDLSQVNIGSDEHKVLMCADAFTQGIFFFWSFNDINEKKGTLNLEECLNEVETSVIPELNKNNPKWRSRKDTDLNDFWLEIELSRYIAYGLLAPNTDFEFVSQAKFGNPLNVVFNNGFEDNRIGVFIHNKETKFEACRLLKEEILNSILGNNFQDEYLDVDLDKKEEQVIKLLRKRKFNEENIEKFVDYYLGEGATNVNFGRDTTLLNTIMLNIASFLGCRNDSNIDIFSDDFKTSYHELSEEEKGFVSRDKTKPAKNMCEIDDVVADNYFTAKYKPKLAYDVAFRLQKLLSDFHK
ncbi:MAG: hypothetical protein E7345_01535 [Clostridiales bacterium]|nr:hypothetical protein [Clostridiales bacterium]